MQLTKEEKGYIAGMIDGEGNLSIKLGKKGYVPRICITNTNEEVLRYIQGLIGGNIYKTSSKREDWKPQIRLEITYEKCRQLLPQISSLLIVKREQAKILQKFLDITKKDAKNQLRGLNNHLWVKNERQLEQKRTLYLAIKALNKKGSFEKQGKFGESLKRNAMVTPSQALSQDKEGVETIDPARKG